MRRHGRDESRVAAKVIVVIVLAAVAGCGDQGESEWVGRDRDRAAAGDRDPKQPKRARGDGGQPGRERADRRDRPPASPAIPPEARPTTIAENTDGDTVVLAATGPSRLIGVDTPEVYGGTECFGPEASDHTAERLSPGTRVFYEFGPERKDQYGRSLVYVWLPGGTFFNAELVREGFATPLAISPNTEYATEFSRLASAARSEDEGLWGKQACDVDQGSSSSGSTGAPRPGGGSGGSNCTPGYSPCLPPADDYDCAGGEGDGPEYAQGPIRVTGSDPYDLDAGRQGIAC